MASLETLTLEIDGSAQKASQGISSLMTSLSALGTVVQNQMGALRSFSAILKEIKDTAGGTGAFKGIANIASSATSSGIKKTARATTEFAKATREFNFKTNENGDILDVNGQAVDKSLPLWVDYYKGELAYFSDAQKKSAASTKQATAAVSNYNKELENTASTTKEATKSVNTLRATTHSASKGLLSTIGRIAKTMLIRTAIRAVMKVARQGLENFYQYSKSIGSAYATAIDGLSAKATVGGNQIGAALGTLLSTIAPILSAIISIVTAAVEAITMLFALLGGSFTWTKATAGAEGFGKAVGGGGSAMKELLADFDELNVIASKGGGGGGGGSGDFGFAFSELQLPQWMIEWKPLIEALVGGTLGALILPKIISLVKTLLDLFTGGGASTLLNILKYWFKKPTGDEPIYNFPTQPDYKPFPSQPTYKEFPTQPTYTEFPIARDYSAMATDMGKISTSMVTFAGAATVAAPLVEKIAASINGMNAGVNVVSVLSSLLQGLASKLLGKTSIKVDKQQWENFKKEFEEWKKDNQYKTIGIRINTDNFDGLKRTLKYWYAEKDKKQITIQVNSTTYDAVKKKIDEWMKATSKKYIHLFLNVKTYEAIKKPVDEWVNKTSKKYVHMFLNVTTFNAIKKPIDAWLTSNTKKIIHVELDIKKYHNNNMAVDQWVHKKDTKKIYVIIDPVSYAAYLLVVTSINAWVKAKAKKTIDVGVNTIIFNTNKKTIDKWVSAKATKGITVELDTKKYLLYLAGAAVVTAWTEIPETKKIIVLMEHTSYTAWGVAAAAVTAWVLLPSIKTVKIKLDGYDTFKTVKNAVDLWVKKNPTKTIKINVKTTYTNEIITKYTTQGTPANNKGSSGNALTDFLFGTSFVDTVSNYLSNLNTNIKTELNKFFNNSTNAPGAGWYAEGGFPGTGDLFIANERGAEYVGSLGSRTTVANNEQIVEGIRRGLSDVNNEQNNLLRQQNELLRRILEKDDRLGASAALGRTVRQSLDMYNSVAGG